MNWRYFLLFGWWLGPLWGVVGLVLCMTLVLWPAGVAMLLRVPEMMFGPN
jgi:uncharacterized membrane protein YccF (DUF307 family)